MVRDERGQRATVAADDQLFATLATLVKLGQAAQLIEGRDSGFKPGTQIAVRRWALLSEVASARAKQRLNLGRRNLVMQRGEHLTQHVGVWLWKELIAFWRELIRVGGLATAAAATHAALARETITLESRQVGADGVVGEVELLGELVYGTRRPA